MKDEEIALIPHFIHSSYVSIFFLIIIAIISLLFLLKLKQKIFSSSGAKMLKEIRKKEKKNITHNIYLIRPLAYIH